MRMRCLSLKLLIVSELLFLSSCKTRSNSGELREIWFNLLDSKWKASQEVSDKNEYIRAFSLLPLKGEIKPPPWSGGIYPSELSGLTYRAQSKKKASQYRPESPMDIKDTSNLSPIEKYDLLLGHQQWELSTAERLRTGAGKDKAIDPKKSLNQDWAAASLLFAEPAPFKVMADSGQPLEFTASDIKALLTRFLSQNSLVDNGVETRSLGGVCRLDSDGLRRGLEPRTLSADAWKDMKNDECYAVNAGAFHLALTNLLGLRQESFVFDPRVDLEFIHYPLLGFRSEIVGAPVVIEHNHRSTQLKTVVTYVLPSPPSPEKSAVPLVRAETYRYTIELDEEGDIVGGTWIGSLAPQLAWIQNRPPFTGDDAKLERLYTSSVSLPSRMAMRNFAAIDSEDPQTPIREADPLVVNRKYRLELSGDVPRGADGLKTFLKSALRPLGLVSIYRNTFADEDSLVSIEVQFHNPTTFRALKQAIRAHSNGRSEVVQVLR